MIIIQSYPLAVALCFLTMLCWGSWANTRKLTHADWPFQLFYWDYAIGVVLLSLVAAFTLGNGGGAGRTFLADLSQAGILALLLAFVGGAVFNLSHIMFVGAIDMVGMAVAYPVAIGIALVVGVVSNYVATPIGDPLLLFAGVAAIVLAIVLNAAAYKRKADHAQHGASMAGVFVSIISGCLMGFFYYFVAASMSSVEAPDETGALVAYDSVSMPGINASDLEFEAEKLGPYLAVVVFSLGIFLSNFVWNSIFMARPFTGERVPWRDYFVKGNARLHAIGILGGVIWNLGMLLSILASGAAGFPISYGLGQGATLVAAIWGVFIWKEFKDAPTGTGKLLALMFVLYVVGLGLIIAAKVD